MSTAVAVAVGIPAGGRHRGAWIGLAASGSCHHQLGEGHLRAHEGAGPRSRPLQYQQKSQASGSSQLPASPRRETAPLRHVAGERRCTQMGCGRLWETLLSVLCSVLPEVGLPHRASVCCGFPTLLCLVAVRSVCPSATHRAPASPQPCTAVSGRYAAGITCCLPGVLTRVPW